jgi:general secretion pathway protein C
VNEVRAPSAAVRSKGFPWIPAPPLRQSARRLLRDVDRYPGLYLPRAAAVALLALIAYQCAALYQAVVMPLESRTERSGPPPQLHPATMLTGFDPFFAVAPAAAGPAEATGLTLHGLRQDRGTGRGSAVIGRSDGAQRSFGVGEEIAPGTRLKTVGFDHVIVVRHGVEERLAFREFSSAAPGAASRAGAFPPPYSPAPAPPVDLRSRRPAPSATAPPARSIDFADPSTLPASLTGAPALPQPRAAAKR